MNTSIPQQNQPIQKLPIIYSNPNSQRPSSQPHAQPVFNTNFNPNKTLNSNNSLIQNQSHYISNDNVQRTNIHQIKQPQYHPINVNNQNNSNLSPARNDFVFNNNPPLQNIQYFNQFNRNQSQPRFISSSYQVPLGHLPSKTMANLKGRVVKFQSNQLNSFPNNQALNIPYSNNISRQPSNISQNGLKNNSRVPQSPVRKVQLPFLDQPMVNHLNQQIIPAQLKQNYIEKNDQKLKKKDYNQVEQKQQNFSEKENMSNLNQSKNHELSFNNNDKNMFEFQRDSPQKEKQILDLNRGQKIQKQNNSEVSIKQNDYEIKNLQKRQIERVESQICKPEQNFLNKEQQKNQIKSQQNDKPVEIESRIEIRKVPKQHGVDNYSYSNFGRRQQFDGSNQDLQASSQRSSKIQRPFKPIKSMTQQEIREQMYKLSEDLGIIKDRRMTESQVKIKRKLNLQNIISYRDLRQYLQKGFVTK